MTPRRAPADDFVPASLRATMAGRAPDSLLASGAVSGEAWLARLPAVLDALLDQWSLTPDGESRHGECALVLPVRRKAERLALKIGWPHAEARFEHLALRAWKGVGAVRLVAAEPSRGALLLERCEPATRLEAMSALDACETIGALHAKLRHPALPQLDTASAWCTRMGQRFAAQSDGLPRRLLHQGISLARDLAADPNVDTTLVHSDLHDANVMHARRAGTVDGLVAIDPKPIAGEAALAVAPLLWNRWQEAADAYNLRNHLRFRVDYACDPMGVAPERARAWVIVRVLDNAVNMLADARGSHPDLTREIAIVKAMSG